MTSSRAKALAIALVAGAALSLSTGPGKAQARVQLGTLNCDVSEGVGLIITSRKTMFCELTGTDGRPIENYVGTLNRFGLDIGATSGGQMAWVVFAPTAGRAAYALAGNYIGGTAEVTAGIGLGANALVGGLNRSVALQPLSIQSSQGLNLAAGVAELNLQPAR